LCDIRGSTTPRWNFHNKYVIIFVKLVVNKQFYVLYKILPCVLRVHCEWKWIFIFQNQPDIVKLIQLNSFLSNHSSILTSRRLHDTFLPRKCYRRQNLLNKPWNQHRKLVRKEITQVKWMTISVFFEIGNHMKDHEILIDLKTLGKSNIAPNMESANRMQEKREFRTRKEVNQN